MKIVALIARLLLGLVFFVFGLNGFFNFLHMGPMPSGLAGQYIGVLFQSHYVYAVSAFQVIGGALLLINRYVPLALTILGPVIVNILLYHLLMDLKGIPMALVVTICWGILFYRNRQYFAGLFVQKTA
jgi:putative oxidoreductase